MEVYPRVSEIWVKFIRPVRIISLAALIFMWEKYSITPREVFFWNSFWSWERPIRLSRQICSMVTWLLKLASR